MGALALATGLAFGLGGRDHAAQVLSRVSQRAEQASPRLAQAAANMQQQAGMAQGHSQWTGVERRRNGNRNYRGLERRIAPA